MDLVEGLVTPKKLKEISVEYSSLLQVKEIVKELAILDKSERIFNLYLRT
ncbi:MAG: hypothetical protein ACP5GU_05875 [Thermoprotei archaeon]|jgi:hypothetical protein